MKVINVKREAIINTKIVRVTLDIGSNAVTFFSDDLTDECALMKDQARLLRELYEKENHDKGMEIRSTMGPS